MSTKVFRGSTVQFVADGKTVTVQRPARVIQGTRGPPGPQGPPGQDGSGAQDPGDLTLIFENNLI